MNSNITLRSNIYVNKTARRDDRDFLSKVKDYRVLKRLLNDPSVLGYNGPDWLSAMQRDILAQGDPQCSLENGTKSWGVPVGGDSMRCRCEQITCSRYNQCSQLWNYDEIVRDSAEEAGKIPMIKTNDLPLYSGDRNSWVDETPINPASNNEPEIPVEPIEEDIPSIVPVTDVPHQEDPVQKAIVTRIPSNEEVQLEPKETDEPVPTKRLDADTIQVVDQAQIIEAPVDVRIWVNAGPGTGKTYTVIQRLLRLLQDGAEALYLCCVFREMRYRR